MIAITLGHTSSVITTYVYYICGVNDLIAFLVSSSVNCLIVGKLSTWYATVSGSNSVNRSLAIDI